MFLVASLRHLTVAWAPNAAGPEALIGVVLVVGAFFTVWTINRRHELALVRAMGAARSYLLRDGLVQALVVLGASIGVGVAVGVGLGGLISGSAVPFAIEAPAVTVAGLLLVVLGLVGAAFAIVRVAATDPLTALGAQR